MSAGLHAWLDAHGIQSFNSFISSGLSLTKSSKQVDGAAMWSMPTCTYSQLQIQMMLSVGRGGSNLSVRAILLPVRTERLGHVPSRLNCLNHSVCECVTPLYTQLWLVSQWKDEWLMCVKVVQKLLQNCCSRQSKWSDVCMYKGPLQGCYNTGSVPCIAAATTALFSAMYLTSA
jgi:hypothetical protein